MSRPSPISVTIDLQGQGVAHGHLNLPHSHDGSAWGAIRIPITLIANGDGPCALLTGGNHGDEYEGPLALVELAQSLHAEDVTGRVIIVPFMNHPAFVAGRRVSPWDGGNMNRAFPGRADGTLTEKIADYFTRVLLPMADLVLDFHSGGKTLDFLPFAASHVLDDAGQLARCRAARDAFGAPFSLEMREMDPLDMYDHAAEQLGKTFVTTELGGGGTATPETAAIARRGVRNLLIHQGILAGEIEKSETRLLHQEDARCFHVSDSAGMVDFDVALGDMCREGDRLARIWDIHHMGRPPVEITAQMAGMVIARHVPGLIAQGDCLAVMANDG